MGVFNKIHRTLVDFMKENGIGGDEAELAITNCAREIGSNSKRAFDKGTTIAVFLYGRARGVSTPVALAFIVGLPTLSVGGTFARSEECSDIRSAIQYWATKKVLAGQQWPSEI